MGTGFSWQSAVALYECEDLRLNASIHVKTGPRIDWHDSLDHTTPTIQFNPGTHVKVKGENQFHKIVPHLHICVWHLCALTHISYPHTIVLF